MMKRIVRFLDIFVFIATTLAIAGVFYEGMELKWFTVVGILIMFMDYSFLLSTVINLFAEKNTKWFKIHIVSLVMLIVAIAMKILGIPYPTVSLVLWYFYLWFLYGIRNAVFYLERTERIANPTSLL